MNAAASEMPKRTARSIAGRYVVSVRSSGFLLDRAGYNCRAFRRGAFDVQLCLASRLFGRLIAAVRYPYANWQHRFLPTLCDPRHARPERDPQQDGHDCAPSRIVSNKERPTSVAVPVDLKKVSSISSAKLVRKAQLEINQRQQKRPIKKLWCGLSACPAKEAGEDLD